LPNLSESLSSMGLNTNTLPDELKTGMPLELSQLLQKGTSTSDESAESTEKPAKKPDRFDKLAEGFTGQFAQIGAVLMAFSPEDGLVIVSRSPHLGARLADVARVNPAVYKALSRYLKESAYINLVTELATISLAILANHGINPVGALMAKMKGKHADGDSELSAVA